jgi:cobalt-zinc-cadmium efflux system membrane fusion protein
MALGEEPHTMFGRIDRYWPALLLGVLVFLMAACDGQQNDGSKTATVAALPGDEVQVPLSSSKRAAIVELTVTAGPAPLMEPVTGKITYDDTRTARITAPIAGRVVSAIPPLGAAVKPNTALLELDSPELGQDKEDYANAVAAEHLSQQALARATTLFTGGVLPRRELQQAEEAATHAHNETQRTLMHLRNLGVADEQINNRYVVRSPVAGVITERHVNPGMEVRPDLTEPLFIVSDLQSVWLLLDVFEKDIGLIEIGSDVTATVPAYPGQRFPARVDYIDKRVDDMTRTVKIRCKLANPDGKLLPAMYATVEVSGKRQTNAVVVPLTALFTEGEGDQVFVKLGDGHYQQRNVKVGLRLKDRAVIIDGLQAGETIVAEGALLLRTEEANEQSGQDTSP